MKTTMHTHDLTRMIMSLFGTKSKPSAHKRFPDEYYKSVYLSKKMFDGVELVARVENLSKKKAVEFLLETGFSRYMGDKLKEHVANEQKNQRIESQKAPLSHSFCQTVEEVLQRTWYGYQEDHLAIITFVF